MRTSLAHSMLSNVESNLRVGNKEIRIFECGRVYLTDELPLTKQPTEKNMLALAVYENGFDFYHLKGIVEDLLLKTGLDYHIIRSSEPFLHPGVSADIMDGDNKVGSFGKIHPQVAKNYDLPKDIYYAELDDDYLLKYSEKKVTMKSISKYPIVERDLAVVVDSQITNEDLMKSIKSACGNLYYDAKLFDVYRSDAIGENKKSMAYNIKLSDMNKTLTDEEVSKVINKVLKTLSYKFGATLR